ncbi:MULTISPECIES: hypothetical protein [Trichococcus]|uniref:Uncharacterized protein n=1 Tax=Trichococcus shcherbakoviae TaxID=2094020 RepID=A0A383TDL8_9LACT|nr:hypothetical protein [Trichococcus shcherbakoviae]SYZ78235.1 Hypothetical protein TART1_1018 [Trichococcus shcherbakoviae]
MLKNGLGLLASRFGLETWAAGMIVTAFTNGGAVVVSAIWPWMFPFVGTLNGLIVTAGAVAAIGW